MKDLIKSLCLAPVGWASAYLKLLGRMRPQWGSILNDRMYEDSIARTASIRHVSSSEGSEINLRIHAPNATCRFRADSFSTKEPETLEWIEQWGGDGAFFDVGANIGLYSLYFAKLFSDKVYAFEPSALNLGLLAKNIALNELSDQIVVMPIPLTASNVTAPLTLSQTNEGGAQSTFGATYGHDGLPLVEKMTYQMPGCSLDFIVESGIIPELPSLLKIDVDGIEHLVLEGAQAVLRSATLRSILIEVNDEFVELASEVGRLLHNSGFKLDAKRHGDMFQTGKFSHTFNQIWVRN
ncbi:MAG: FkbM family methyltransferase [Candidatus Nanopelagicales bacterium]|nr:FkbM family methyltransferase [Candidatus Nanopelagicales bacterium]